MALVFHERCKAMGFLIVLSVGLLSGLAWCVYTRDPRMTRAEALSRTFQERVQNFRQHINTLEAHSDEYRAVFDDNEWEKLVATIARLEGVSAQVRDLMSRNDYQSALSTLEQVINPSNAETNLERVDHDIHQIEELLNWELRLHSMLKKVVFNLEVAAVETNRLSNQRKSPSTRPTLVTLADIKKQLLEDEEIRKMIS
jgi:ABC-type transporter Mla subunit MlaD